MHKNVARQQYDQTDHISVHCSLHTCLKCLLPKELVDLNCIKVIEKRAFCRHWEKLVSDISIKNALQVYKKIINQTICNSCSGFVGI